MTSFQPPVLYLLINLQFSSGCKLNRSVPSRGTRCFSKDTVHYSKPCIRGLHRAKHGVFGWNYISVYFQLRSHVLSLGGVGEFQQPRVPSFIHLNVCMFIWFVSILMDAWPQALRAHQARPRQDNIDTSLIVIILPRWCNKLNKQLQAAISRENFPISFHFEGILYTKTKHSRVQHMSLLVQNEWIGRDFDS